MKKGNALKSLISLLGIIYLSGCVFFEENSKIKSSDFLTQLAEENLNCMPLKADSHQDLLSPFKPLKPVGVYQGEDFVFIVLDIPIKQMDRFNVKNKSYTFANNQNLAIYGKGGNSAKYVNTLNRTKPPVSIWQIGYFVYPLGICLILSVFISTERFYSLRPGLTFPRKVENALRSGEFPNSKWKKRSSAERIVWVATKEKPSLDSLRSYARLEIVSMDRGMFILEIVISAAPLIGLLGTVTGLVRVFSQIPAGGGVGSTTIFSEGIAMALLTTIIGLAIAIPTLVSHSYLSRLTEKRASSLDWLTERIADAVYGEGRKPKVVEEVTNESN